MTNLERIQSLETENNNAKIEKAKLEERLKALQEENSKLLASLKEVGVSAEELSTKISELNGKLESQIAEIENEIK